MRRVINSALVISLDVGLLGGFLSKKRGVVPDDSYIVCEGTRGLRSRSVDAGDA